MPKVLALFSNAYAYLLFSKLYGILQRKPLMLMLERSRETLSLLLILTTSGTVYPAPRRDRARAPPVSGRPVDPARCARVTMKRAKYRHFGAFADLT